ncbi:unnamed protein product, partial [Scytosiphon promiscuus]
EHHKTRPAADTDVHAMPARKMSTSSTKRKSVDSVPSASGADAKKHRQPTGAATHRFLRGLAAQLASEADEADGQVHIDIHGALQAALEALPKGKLKGSLLKSEHEALQTLVAEFESVRQQQGEREREPESDGRGRSDAATPGDAVAAGASAGDIVPCTVQLYRRARAIAEEAGSCTKESKLLKALALSPRAPLDLLVDAVGATDAGSTLGDLAAIASPTLESAVAGLRSLAKALGADPRAALSPAGLAYFADRAAVLASSAAKVLASDGADGVGDEAGEAAEATTGEALGLMLRILQVAGMGLSAPGGAMVAGEGDAGNGDGCAQGEAACDRLLLPCSPEASSPSKQAGPPPSARRSVARLLAHYVVAAAACCTRRQSRAGGAAAVIKRARAAAAGQARSTDPDNATDDDSSDSSDDDDSDGDGDGEGAASLSRHLSALCAANLAGNELATLEFLRCVGDALFVAPEAGTAMASSPPSVGGGGGGGGVSIFVCVAPACARALARLPRPSASPAPTAAEFLRRAYAFRVVDALDQSAASASLLSSLSGSARKGAATTSAAVSLVSRGRGGRRSAASGAPSQGAARTPARWDFVGEAGAPPSLLHFLGRPEGPVAVGKGPAGAALKKLASRRQSPAEVAELLRSSPACAPSALGPLLSAMEGLEVNAQ